MAGAKPITPTNETKQNVLSNFAVRFLFRQYLRQWLGLSHSPHSEMSCNLVAYDLLQFVF